MRTAWDCFPKQCLSCPGSTPCYHSHAGESTSICATVIQLVFIPGSPLHPRSSYADLTHPACIQDPQLIHLYVLDAVTSWIIVIIELLRDCLLSLVIHHHCRYRPAGTRITANYHLLLGTIPCRPAAYINTVACSSLRVPFDFPSPADLIQFSFQMPK